MPRDVARTVFRSAREALERAEAALDASFDAAVDLVAGGRTGRVVTTGMGKSGDVARKLAATLRSTCTPAVYLHPGEAAHGDLGLVGAGDVVVAVSQSGRTPEVLDLLPAFARMRCPVVALTGSPRSALARAAAVILDAGSPVEGGGLGFPPTTSATVALVMGDALAMAVARRRGVGAADLAILHPGGTLGRRLALRVEDVLPRPAANPVVPGRASMREAISAIGEGGAGAVSVLGSGGEVAGILTDGDVRRAVLRGGGLLDGGVAGWMTRGPVTVEPATPAVEALRRMEDRPTQIAVLPVVDPASGRPLAMLRLHDLVRAGL